MSDATTPRDEVRQRIVGTAVQLLETGGAAALTTRAVAQAAGVQAPTIYRLFGDKDGLLEAVAEHVMAAQVAGKTATVAAAVAAEVDPVEELRAGWLAQVRFGVEHPELHALMSDPSRGRRSAAAQAGWLVLQRGVPRGAATGRLRVSEARAIDMIAATGNGAVLATLRRPPADRDPELPVALWDAAAAQILTVATPSVEPDDGPLAAAVTIRASVSALPALTTAERALLADWLDRVIAALQRPAG